MAFEALFVISVVLIRLYTNKASEVQLVPTHHTVESSNISQIIEMQLNQRRLIIGGTPTTAAQYPFIAKLTGCGGSILRKESPAIILTAAHCNHGGIQFENEIWLYDQIEVTVQKYEIHPSYNYPNCDYDIAILWIKEDISSYSQLETVTIEPVTYGSECCNKEDVVQTLGYGYYPQQTLEYVDLLYVNRATCDAMYDSVTISNRMNCAGALGKGTGPLADGGGPLIRKNTNKQVGIISLCDEVFTDVGVFYDWIKQSTGLIDEFCITAGWSSGTYKIETQRHNNMAVYKRIPGTGTGSYANENRLIYWIGGGYGWAIYFYINPATYGYGGCNDDISKCFSYKKGYCSPNANIFINNKYILLMVTSCIVSSFTTVCVIYCVYKCWMKKKVNKFKILKMIDNEDTDEEDLMENEV